MRVLWCAAQTVLQAMECKVVVCPVRSVQSALTHLEEQYLANLAQQGQLPSQQDRVRVVSVATSNTGQAAVAGTSCKNNERSHKLSWSLSTAVGQLRIGNVLPAQAGC